MPSCGKLELKLLKKLNKRFSKLLFCDNVEREHAKKLADDNAKLHDTLRQSEKETMEVFSYLKKENDAKDKELNELREKIEHLIASHENDKELLLNDIKDQMLCINTEKEKECKRVKELENEIQQLGEYKSDRIRTENEIKQLRSMVESQKSLIEQMELKFFEEKLRIRETSIKDIKALAEEAHRTSIKNLDDSAKLSFVQNVAMRRFISHLKSQLVSAEDLSKSLNTENKKLTLEKETLECSLLAKTSECRRLNELIREKDKKIEICENQIQNLNDTVLKQKSELQGQVVLHTSESAKSIERLTKTLELERKRMNRICGLANKILQQRSEIEEFFISSLDYVRDEIKVNQNNYIHDSKSAYEASLRLAHCGKSTYPPVRTFQNTMSSTNNVYDDFKIAHQIPRSARLTIRDLTWEQKERVLSILFEKINNNNKMKTKGINKTQRNSSDTSNCQNTENSKLSISRESTHLIDSKRLTKRILDSIRSNNESVLRTSSWREVDEAVEEDREEKERNSSCEALQWQVNGNSTDLSEDNNPGLIPSKDLLSLQSNLGNIEEKSSRKKVLSAPDFRGEQTSTPYPSPQTKDDITHLESAHSN
uniref:Uncharacterized protein n=1 Tax=Trichobilharzia regenti TaxID=157069 RepID=A0AA85K8U7_TRIRE|nr:unnamed protein product [Trichobilharzia regenti]